jgi:hypothetical protein
MKSERNAHEEELVQLRMKLNEYQASSRREETGKL